MNKICTFVAVAGLTLGIVGFSQAQGAGPQGGAGVGAGKVKGQGAAGQGARRGMMRLNQSILAKLELTKEQKDKVQALQKKTQEQMRSLMEKPGDRREKRPEMMKIAKSHHEALMKILTPEQQKKYEAARKEAIEKMRKERGEGGGRVGKPGKPGASGKGGGGA